MTIIFMLPLLMLLAFVVDSGIYIGDSSANASAALQAARAGAQQLSASSLHQDSLNINDFQAEVAACQYITASNVRIDGQVPSCSATVQNKTVQVTLEFNTPTPMLGSFFGLGTIQVRATESATNLSGA